MADQGQRVYRFLDLTVGLRSDRPETLDFLDTMYGHLREIDGDVGAADLKATLRNRAPDGSYTLEIGSHVHRLADPPMTDVHAYSIVFGQFLERLDGFFFIHGAALTDGERTLILSGPTGHGKTTLSLELLDRGFRLLSDDFAPLGRRDGLVHPFPKRVGLKRDPDDDDPRALPEALRNANPVAMGDKWLLDPHGLPGSLETRPRSVTHVLMLNPCELSGNTDGTHRFRIGMVYGHDEFLATLQGLSGVEISTATTPGGRPAIDVEVRGDVSSLAGFYEACARHRHQLLLFQPSRSPLLFEGEPVIESMGLFQSAVSLLREVLNRGADGRLQQSAEGNLTPLLTELVTLLSGARCAGLRAGTREATADRIADWVRSEAP